MSDRNRIQFGVSFSKEQGDFVQRALNETAGVRLSVLAKKSVLKWAESVLSEKAPTGDARGRHFSEGANPNGLTATARRLGVSTQELRKRLLKEALERLSSGNAAAAE